MQTPEWVKPGVYGAAVGAIALAVVGFGWGGWLTGAKVQQAINDGARTQVIAALLPICLEQSKKDPQLSKTLAQLKEAASYQRSDLLMKTGWATMPGSTDPNRNVASACVDKLAAQF
jgi:hypothetical protein